MSNDATASWLDPPTDAPREARCSVCGGRVTGTEYLWLAAFPVTSDIRVTFAHPKCLEELQRVQ